MALPGYCIGDLVEDAGFLAANERAMRGLRTPPAASPPSSASSISIRRRETKAARSGSTTPRRSFATARSCSARTRRCFQVTATSTTSASSRPATCREPVTVPRAAGRCRLGVSICEDLWDEFYDVKPLPSSSRRARTCSSTSTPRRSVRASARRATRLIRRHLARAARAARLHQHDRGGRQRQEHHPVRRREPGLRRRRTADRDRPAVRGAAARRRPRRRAADRRCRCRRSTATARCTTAW